LPLARRIRHAQVERSHGHHAMRLEGTRSDDTRVGAILGPSAWLVAGAVVGRGATLVAITAVARLLSPSEFGRLAVLQVTVTLLAGIAGLGLGIALTRQVAEATASNRADAGSYVGLALLTTLVAGLITTGIYLLARSEVASEILQDPAATTAVVASAGAVLFGAVGTNSQGALLGLEAFRSTAVAQWSLGLGVAAGLLFGAWSGGLQGALAGLSIGTAVGAVVSTALLVKEMVRRGLRISWLPARRIWRSLWRPAAPAFVAFLTVSLALLLAQLKLARQVDGYAEVGLFNLSYRWHLALLFIPAVIVPALLPKLTRLLAEGRELGGRRLFRLYGLGTLILTVPPALVMALAAVPILSLSGEYYAEHPLPLVILAVASIPSALNNVLSNGAVGAGAIRAWLVSDVALAAVLLGFAFALVPSHAATGLAIAYLLAYTVTDAVLIYPLRRLFIADAPQSV
jgi:O-antigen/teichoic acid export membrane protein